VLLTSSILAIATTRLASRKVLVQQTYCVETLARVDTLCLDKTGTITTGRMEVSRVEPAPGHTLSEVDKALAEVVRASEGASRLRKQGWRREGRGSAARGPLQLAAQVLWLRDV
jgi:P-type E1-E2 ATPase